MSSPINPTLKCVDLSEVDVYSDNPVVDSRYRLAVEEMAKQGAHVQIRCSDGSWYTQRFPAWNWSAWVYRISPLSRPKEMVPWDCLDDLEKSGAMYVRLKEEDASWSLIVSAGKAGFQFATAVRLGIAYWHDTIHYEWSIDRKTWFPFTKPKV